MSSPKIFICHGMPRSGSSFATQIVLGLIEANNLKWLDLKHFLPESKGVFVLWPNDLNKVIESFIISQEFKEDMYIMVIKYHLEPTDLVRNLLKEGIAKAISTYRNPIECLISCYNVAIYEKEKRENVRFNYNSFFDIIKDIDYYIKCHLEWRVLKNVYEIKFNELISNPYEIGLKIADFLGIEYHDEPIKYILEDKSRILEYGKYGSQKVTLNNLDKKIYSYCYSRWKYFIEQI